MSYHVTVLHNAYRRAMIDGANIGDVFEQVFETEVDAGSLRDAAQEMFDLTNNPARHAECVARGYGTRRSISVGDILVVRDPFGTAYLACAHMGWYLFLLVDKEDGPSSNGHVVEVAS